MALGVRLATLTARQRGLLGVRIVRHDRVMAHFKHGGLHTRAGLPDSALRRRSSGYPLNLTTFGNFVARQGVKKIKQAGLVRYQGITVKIVSADVAGGQS